jgi:hypothetical protein
MSLERKDVRFKLHPDVHQALTVLAEVRGVDIGELVESIVVRDVVKEVHEATVVAQRTAALGISGKSRESLGASGK